MTPIPGPILLFGLPLAAALITYLLRRWAFLAAPLSALTSGALAFLCLQLPLDQSAFVLGQEVAFGRPVVVIGRTLVLDTAGQGWLALIFSLAAVTFLAAWRPSQGRSFHSFSLAVLALYAAVVLIRPFSLALLVFAMATTPTVFILQAGQPRSVQGAQRYLLVTLLAVPLLLAAAWLVGSSVVNPNVAQVARLAALPAALGFGLLLAIFPFGTWMPALAADAPPLATLFVFTIGQSMAVFLALAFLRESPAFLSDPAVFEAIQITGLVMVASGGLMAAVQRDFGRLLGYAALSDLGVLLLAFGIGGSQGLLLALLHLVNRALPIALMATALATLRHRATTDQFSRLQGMARRLPVATAGLFLGGLGLAGFPGTAGFATHWAAGRAVGTEHWTWTLILVGASAAILIGLLRGLGAMAGSLPREGVARQPRFASLMVLILAALSIAVGLYPQLLLEPVQEVVSAFSLF